MEAQKECELDVSGDEDPETVVKPHRTRKEALQAALVMREYLQELNIPYARKLEANIFSFGYQTRHLESQSMKSTHIADYFVRN
ncbi:hypothetical protein EI94DRAFT_359920 [Lactarius quietus]|nr:hypothetical protein EI94DRAFT_359920 [Lactarius quietus]